MYQAVASPTRRQELASFLRVRRDSMLPVDFGFEPEEDRRVAGLRREEVAALAGISTTWYTWLEQGREINVSDEVVDKIASAMRLSDAEREYVRLMLGDEQPLEYTLHPEIPDVLRVLIESHQAAPAYIATPRFDLLVWNDFLGEVLDYSKDGNALSRNIVWRMFFDKSRRKLYVDWEDAARRTVAAFRYTRAKYLGDSHFEALLQRLLDSPDFARLWALQEVGQPGMPPFLIRHDTLGLCEMTTVQASLTIATGCYLALFASRQLS